MKEKSVIDKNIDNNIKKNPKYCKYLGFSIGRWEDRTPDILGVNQTLVPAELTVRWCLIYYQREKF